MTRGVEGVEGISGERGRWELQVELRSQGLQPFKNYLFLLRNISNYNKLSSPITM